MKILTKKYRLIWNQKNELITDPYLEYLDSETIAEEGCTSFETDDIEEIKEIFS